LKDLKIGEIKSMRNLDVKKWSKYLLIYLSFFCIMIYLGAAITIPLNVKNMQILIMTIFTLVFITIPVIMITLIYLEIESRNIKGLEKIEKDIKKIKIKMFMYYGVPLFIEIIILICFIAFFGSDIVVYAPMIQLMVITIALIKVFRPYEDTLAKSRKFKDYLEVLNNSIYPNLDRLCEAFEHEDISDIRNLKHSTEPIFNWMMEKISDELYAGNKYVINYNHGNHGKISIKKINKEKGYIQYILDSNEDNNTKNKEVLSDFLDILKKEIEKYKQIHNNENNLPFTELELRKWQLI
ncbi:MAG: hypothetical protein ACFFAO_13955, partial [Candidatus Hermodarchaeota archaeon]